MKRATTRLLFLFIACLLFITHLFAQDKQQQNQVVFERVCAFINKQDAEGMWALTNNDFKTHITWDNFENFAKFGIFPQGTISSTSLTEYKNGISDYKTTFSTGDFSLKLALDATGKISYLLFKKLAPSTIQEKAKTYTPKPGATGIEKVIEEAAAEYINKGNTVGLSIGILQNGILRTYNYGETQKGNGEAPSSHSAYEIGSITKTFTATLLAYYANTGKVSLTDPITKYLPDSVKKNNALQGITLQMLANHTSGLARIPDNLMRDGTNQLNPYKDYDRKKLFAYLKTCKPESRPGTKCSYSNTGVGLLGTILEIVNKKKYPQMVDEIITTPLKLENTGIRFTGEHHPQVLPVYNDDGAATPLWDFDALAGAGALRSTASDLVKYAEANLDLNTSPLSKALALTHVITYDKENTIGLGWFKKKVGTTSIYWHNGGTMGSSSFVAFIPGKGIAISVLANCAQHVDELAEKILLAASE